MVNHNNWTFHPAVWCGLLLLMRFRKHTLHVMVVNVWQQSNCLLRPLICQFPLTVDRQSDVNADVVSAFVSNAACNNMSASVTLPQKKGLLLRGLIKLLFIEDDSYECQMSLYESNNYLCIYRVLHLNIITEVGTSFYILLLCFFLMIHIQPVLYLLVTIAGSWSLHNYSQDVAGAVDILNDNKIISGFPCKSETKKQFFLQEMCRFIYLLQLCQITL